MRRLQYHLPVKKGSKSAGLEKKDAINQARWRVGVREIAAGVIKSGHPRLQG